MSETKHTPGPWQYCFEGETAAFILEHDGSTVVKLSVTMNTTAHSALVANARLIAAAPELLEALEKLYALVEGESPSLLDEDSGGDSRLDIEICAAIAKAKGEGV